MDLSKRANLLGVREVRGLLSAEPDSGLLGADWAPLIQMRATESDGSWTYAGEASIVDHPYVVRDLWGEYEETIRAGAFDKTLSENPDVMLNYMHDPATTMATTRGGALNLRADPNLAVEAVVPKSDVDAQRVMPKVQRGDAASMSFAFRVVRQSWNEDYTQRDILEVNLHRGDVAVIVTGLGANPAAHGALRSELNLDEVLRYLDENPDPEWLERLSATLTGREAVEPEPTEGLDPEFLKELVAVQLRGRE